MLLDPLFTILCCLRATQGGSQNRPKIDGKSIPRAFYVKACFEHASKLPPEPLRSHLKTIFEKNKNQILGLNLGPNLEGPGGPTNQGFRFYVDVASQEPPKTSPRALGTDFWSNFGRFLIVFLLICQRFVSVSVHFKIDPY